MTGIGQTITVLWRALGLRSVPFLLATFARLPAYKRGLLAREPDPGRAAFYDLAAPAMLLYQQLKERLGQERALALMREIVIPTGVRLFERDFRRERLPRTWEDLLRLLGEMGDRPTTRWNVKEVVERSERRYHLRVTWCMYHAVFTREGMGELTPLFCDVDERFFEAHLPGWLRFHRGGPGHTLGYWHTCCEFIFERRQGP